MIVQDSRYRVGPFVLREERLPEGARRAISADVAVLTPGWEARAEAALTALDIQSTTRAYLDFQVIGAKSSLIAPQVAKMKVAGFLPITLRQSVDIEINRNKVVNALRNWSVLGARSLFLDITSLPKAYIQGLICATLGDGLFAKVTLGYAEGIYRQGVHDDSLESAIDFQSANPMSGGAGPCREKRLIVVLGGERANCYALIEKVAPDTIHVFATQSSSHPEQQPGIETQISKIKSIYLDRLAEVVPIDAFSMRSFLDAADTRRFPSNNGVATTVFVGGTKPHAAASAILACGSRQGLDLRYRRVKAYDTAAVDWAGRYYLYEVVDLRSAALAKCFPW